MTDSYGRLADRLRGGGEDAADRDAPTVTAFPDGSVDSYSRVAAGGSAIDSRREFGRAVADRDRESFRLLREAVEPGGQAVNVARQADALGADVTLFGHLDHPALAALPFETESMGEPAQVDVLQFEEADVMLSTESDDVQEWTLDDLRAVADDYEAAMGADAVCAVNWASFPALRDALRELADADLGDGESVLLFDAGSVVDCDADAVADLGETLGALEAGYDVVVSANDAEVDRYAEALCDGGGANDARAGRAPEDRLRAIREAIDVTAVAAHGADRAAAAVRDRSGVVSVSKAELASPARLTGAGDRFGAGLAAGLARDWGWEASLALGNVCSSHYVATGETGGPAALADRCEEIAGGD